MLICACKVKYVDDFNCETHTEYSITQGENLVDVTKNLSNYYGEDDIISLTVSPISDEFPIVEINQKIYEDLINHVF